WCYFNVEDKVCQCKEGYSEKNGKCEVCDCGENTVCRFVFGAKACDCLPGYLFNSYLQKCAECDCGIEGSCYFKEGKKKCDCPTKFLEVNGKCKECDCGKNGECELDLYENPKCSCFDGFAERRNGSKATCNETCSEDADCENGGICKKEAGGKFCHCPSGTSGDRCEIIDECENGRYQNCKGNSGTCEYDLFVKKAVCTCPDGMTLHHRDNICRECDCGDHGNCQFDDLGIKRCTCHEGYAVRTIGCRTALC
ncbi:uncharacterized protein CEXT_216511, partial [Caerostris extrusa]